jgi:hypothetical protein
MGKQKKFLTIREAMRDIIDSLLRPDCVEEIAEIYSFLEGGKARPNKGTHPLMDNKAPGIMYKPEKLDYEEFYDWREFEDLLTRALEDKLPEDVDRWKSEDRYDILNFVDQSSFFNDIWINQETEKELKMVFPFQLSILDTAS